MPYTELVCLYNTHRTVDATTHDVAEEKRKLASLIKDQLYTPDVLRQLLLVQTDKEYEEKSPYTGGKLISVRLRAGGAEVGSKVHALHVHFILSIEHNGKLVLGDVGDRGNLTNRFRAWLDEASGNTVKGYFQAKLSGVTRLKNYNTKGGQRRVAGVRVNASANRAPVQHERSTDGVDTESNTDNDMARRGQDAARREGGEVREQTQVLARRGDADEDAL